MKQNLQINDLVLSSNFGLGKIVGFETVGDANQNFVVIESLEKKIKVLAPITENLNFRKLSAADELKERLNNLKNLVSKKEFESKKDRITYFKGQSNKQDLNSIFETIVELRDLEDRGSVENKIYENLVDNIKLELTTVTDMDKDDASQYVDNSLKH